MEWNLVIRNLKDFVFQKEYKVARTDEKPICFYLDAATYNNLGDQAIALAIEIFLNGILGKEQVRVINETGIIKYIKSLKKQISPKDIIALSGGGNMGDLYPRYEALRRLVIKTFPENKIIIFPQTIDYSKDAYGIKELKRVKMLYGGHKRLMMCAREKRTLDIIRKFCKNTVFVPDIVLSLYGKFSIQTDRKRIIGFCLRNDNESVLKENGINQLLKEAKAIGINTAILSTEGSVKILGDYKSRKKEIERKIEEFAKCECIVTDRLHGMIFCILANTPCIVIDNNNHKVYGVYDSIKNHLTGVCKFEDFDSLKDAIRCIEKERTNLSIPETDYDPIIQELKE